MGYLLLMGAIIVGLVLFCLTGKKAGSGGT